MKCPICNKELMIHMGTMYTDEYCIESHYLLTNWESGSKTYIIGELYIDEYHEHLIEEAIKTTRGNYMSKGYLSWKKDGF